MKVAFLSIDVREFIRDYSAPRPSFGNAPEALLKGFAQIPNDVEVHVISCLRGHVPPRDQLAPNIFYHSLFVPPLGWGKTLYAGCVRAVRKKLREIKPDIVHAQGTEKECSVCAVYSGYPNVLTIHGNLRQVAKAIKVSRFSALGIMAFLEGWVLPRANGVVCLTRYTERQVADAAKKTWIVPNAVDPSFFDVQRKPSKKQNILCVANIIPYKNQVGLIRALDPVAESNGIRLVFLGKIERDDAYSEEFKTLVSARPWCVHHGFQSGNSLKNELAEAQMLILPTLEDNCPMVVLEAAAVGTPVAASNIGGIPDLIDHDKNGLLFDPSNAEEIRRCALRLFNDNDLAERMAAAAKTRALERHHPAVIARRHVEIYREVCSQKRA